MAAGERTRQQADAFAEQRQREARYARVAAVAFVVAIVAALALIAVYLAGGQTQAEGALLTVAFGALGTGLAVWVKRVVGHTEVVEERYPLRSPETERDDFEQAYEEALGEATVGGRRRFLLRLLAGAGASLGVALLLPLRSLGPSPSGEMFNTSWSRGMRLADLQGRTYRPEDLSADQVVTVFPADDVGSTESQAILVGTRPGELVTDELPAPTVDGLVCYSKICTHAGCPVGLYRASVGELLCPCHQSTFDVNRGAKVLSGPTGRPLPQLPIGVDDEGYLIALGDFVEPVGPSFWNMTQRSSGGGA